MDEIVDMHWNDETEDQFKSSWDFHSVDDVPIDNLADLASATGRTQGDLAYDILHLPFGKAAPERLKQEAMNYGRDRR